LGLQTALDGSAIAPINGAVVALLTDIVYIVNHNPQRRNAANPACQGRIIPARAKWADQNARR